ncbi:MAG: hypothetical protein ACLFVG_01640 [Candidatus Aminicenantes bacterium]
MKAFFAFAILVLIALLGSRFLFKKRTALSPLTYFIFSGLIYIFLGSLLGKQGLNVLSPPVLKGFSPLIGFGLGWIGFLFGFQLEFRYLGKFSKKFFGLSFLQFIIVFLLVALSLAVILNFLYTSRPTFLLLGMAAGWGLLCTLNSPSLLNLASSQIPRKGNYLYLARFLVSVSGFWGISGLAVISCFWHFPFFESHVFTNGMVLFFSLLIFAFLLGYLFHFLTMRKALEKDVFVFLLSLVFFGSGAALYFNLPPLFICMMMGMTFSNLTKIQEKLYPLLLSSEKPVYIVFLVLIGALWDIRFNHKIALLVAVLLMLRILAYTAPLPSLKVLFRFPFPLPPLFGLSFLSPGGLAVAFAISIKVMYLLPLTDIFVSVALLSIIISEMFSPWLLKKSLMKLEEEE